MYVCYKNMSLFSGDWAEDDDYFLIKNSSQNSFLSVQNKVKFSLKPQDSLPQPDALFWTTVPLTSS